MKIHEPGSDRKVELLVKANGKKCDEYIPEATASTEMSAPWWDEDGALCCWTGIGTKQELVIQCRMSASVGKRGGVIDILIDGVHRFCHHFKSRKASDEKDHVISFPALYSKIDGAFQRCAMLTGYLQEQQMQDYGNVGVIELRISLQDPDRPDAKYATDLSNFSWDDIHDPRATGGQHVIRPTHHIEFLPGVPASWAQNNVSKQNYLKKVRQPRPGSRAWITVKFLYRSEDDLIIQGIDEAPNIWWPIRNITTNQQPPEATAVLPTSTIHHAAGQQALFGRLPSKFTSDKPDSCSDDDSSATHILHEARDITEKARLIRERFTLRGQRSGDGQSREVPNPRGSSDTLDSLPNTLSPEAIAAPVDNDTTSGIERQLERIDGGAAAKQGAGTVFNRTIVEGSDERAPAIEEGEPPVNMDKDSALYLYGSARQSLSAPVAPMTTAASKNHSHLNNDSNNILSAFKASGAVIHKRNSTGSNVGAIKKPRTDFEALERKVAELQRNVEKSKMKKLEAEKKAADSKQRREAAILKHIAALEKKNKETEQLAQKALEEAEENDRFIRELDATNTTNTEVDEQDG